MEENNNLTEEELKSIDESETIESGEWDNEDTKLIAKAYIGIIFLAVLLTLEIYFNLNLYGLAAILCLLVFVIQIR